MKAITVYDSVGRIHQIHKGVFFELILEEGFFQAEGEYDSAEYYFNDHKPALKPSFNIQVSGNTLSGVPAGAKLEIEGESYIADGSDIELSFIYPGTYRIKVSCWPYLDKEIIFEN